MQKGSLRQKFAWVLFVARKEFKCFQGSFFKVLRGSREALSSSLTFIQVRQGVPKLASLRPRPARFTNVRRDPTRFKTRWGLVGVPLEFSGFRSGPWRFAEVLAKVEFVPRYPNVFRCSLNISEIPSSDLRSREDLSGLSSFLRCSEVIKDN